MELKLLVNCRDDYEAQLVEGLLKGAGIPVQRRYRGFGHAHKFFSGLGRDIDLFVPADRLAEARSLLEAAREQGEED